MNHPHPPVWYEVVGYGGVLVALLAYLLIHTSQRYIVRRYEEETSLSKLHFFSYATWLGMFTPGMQKSLKRGLYTLHVFMAKVLPDAWMRRLRSFSDVTDRQEILKHFSKGEVALAVVIGAMFVAFMISLVIFFALKPFFPKLAR